MTKMGWIMVVLTGIVTFIFAVFFVNLIGCAPKQEKIVLIPGQQVEIKTFRKIYTIQAEPSKIQFDGDFKEFLNSFTEPSKQKKSLK